MIGNSANVEILRLANNDLNYDSIQAIVKAISNHPALAHIDLSANPISTAGGRALLRYGHPYCVV